VFFFRGAVGADTDGLGDAVSGHYREGYLLVELGLTFTSQLM
jgi:hypothetical protein